MTTTIEAPPALATIADLLDSLGGIPPARVRLHPTPGTATEQDAIAITERENRACELIDGVLVEKAMGLLESLLASELIAILLAFVKPRKLGFVAGESGMLRLFPGMIRMPDVSFISTERLAGIRLLKVAAPDIAPDLAVEFISPGNTRAEMKRKLHNYFDAGSRLVWYIDPRTRTAVVYTGVEQSVALTEADALDGGDVLPGFSLPLRELFAVLDEVG